VAGLVSSANAAFANDWWNKPQDDLRMRQVAKYINQYDKAAVIFIQANSDVATTLGICNLLRRDAHVCTCNQELPWNFPTGYKHVFAYIADNHYERSEEYLLSRPGPKPKSVFQHILFRYDNAEP
jgi:hypothetical protein